MGWCMNEKPSAAILVLGMHRSGTSAATRVLNLLGVDLGKELLQPAEDNPKGFWEHRQVVAIHERLLSELGRSWHDIRSLPKGWVESAAARDARDALLSTLSRDFSASPIWAVKDPRLCRLLPLWTPLADELGVRFHALHVARHPDEVAGSLRVRNDLSLEYVRLLWLQYVAEAHAGTSELPRALLHFDLLLDDWKCQIAAIADELRLEWSISPGTAELDIDEFLNPLERHHVANMLQAPAVPRLIRRLHDACHAPVKEVSWPTLDLLVAECQEAIESLLPGLDLFQQQFEQALVQLNSANRVAEDLQRKNESLSISLGSLVARLPKHSIEDDQAADEAKIYHRCEGDIYLEARAISCSWPASDVHARLVFSFNPDVRVDFLRFDPAKRAGEFEVSGIWVDGTPLQVEQRVRNVNQFRLPGSAGLLRFGAWNEDPWVELDLIGVLQGAAVNKIEIACKRVGVVQELLDTVEGRLLASLRPLSDDLEAVREVCFANSEALQALNEISRSQLENDAFLAVGAAEEKQQLRDALEVLKCQVGNGTSQTASAHVELQDKLGDLIRRVETSAERVASKQMKLQKELDGVLRELHARAQRGAVIGTTLQGQLKDLYCKVDEDIERGIASQVAFREWSEDFERKLEGVVRRSESNQSLVQERLDDMDRCYKGISERLNRRWYDVLRGKR